VSEKPAFTRLLLGQLGTAMSVLLIYGATGYTAKLVVEHAVASCLRPILAGRNEPKVRQLAERHGLDWRAFSVALRQRGRAPRANYNGGTFTNIDLRNQWSR
jgi:hypothetical protein